MVPNLDDYLTLTYSYYAVIEEVISEAEMNYHVFGPDFENRFDDLCVIEAFFGSSETCENIMRLQA